MRHDRLSEERRGFAPSQLDRARELVALIADGRRRIARIKAEIVAATRELAGIADAASSDAPTSWHGSPTRRLISMRGWTSAW